VEKVVVGIVLALVAAGCRDAPFPTPPPTPPTVGGGHPSAMAEIAVEGVRALVPDRWDTVPAPTPMHRGVLASPEPRAWPRIDGSVTGIAATYVDVGAAGVPSDYFYLAARSSGLRELNRSRDCRAERRRVVVDNVPRFLQGTKRSTGDYLMTAEGACTVRDTPTRWAYLVAAPGYGAMRRVGIPSSGLYVFVAVAPDTRRGSGLLDRLVSGARFGDAGITDLIDAARGPRAL
jgi:hypothetical protein